MQNKDQFVHFRNVTDMKTQIEATLLDIWLRLEVWNGILLDVQKIREKSFNNINIQYSFVATPLGHTHFGLKYRYRYFIN